MTSSNIPAPYAVGLNGDAALRYALAQMVTSSPRCDPCNYLATAEALYGFIKRDGEPSSSGYFTPINVAGATFFVEGDAGQTHHIRQEDQSRG